MVQESERMPPCADKPVHHRTSDHIGTAGAKKARASLLSSTSPPISHAKTWAGGCGRTAVKQRHTRGGNTGRSRGEVGRLAKTQVRYNNGDAERSSTMTESSPEGVLNHSIVEDWGDGGPGVGNYHCGTSSACTRFESFDDNTAVHDRDSGRIGGPGGGDCGILNSGNGESAKETWGEWRTVCRTRKTVETVELPRGGGREVGTLPQGLRYRVGARRRKAGKHVAFRLVLFLFIL